MHSVQCTNPDCGSSIQVPPGAIQVICYACNTWHRLDEEQANPSIAPPVAGDAYSAPPPPAAGPASSDGPVIPDYNAPSGAFIPKPDKEAITPQLHRPGLLRTNEGIKFPLQPGKNTIGRRHGDILLDDTTVSRSHAVVEVNRSASGSWQYYVTDIGHSSGKASTNGVYVSGRTQRLSNEERIPISYGSLIEVGKVCLELIFPQ